MGSEPADGPFDLAHAQQALWRNYAGYSGLGAHLPGGKLTADGPIHWVDSGGPLFSRVFETALGEADADNAIDLLRASFARRRHTLAWLVEERSTPGDLGNRLERAGLRHAYDWLGMARDLAVHPPRPRDIPRGVGLIRVGAAKALWGWVDVTAEAFGIHPSVVNRKYAAFARFVEAEPQSVTPWILTSGGFAVAALLTYDDGENIGLYWVGTRKRFRRRGFGAMLIELALSAHGQTKGPRRYCVLHAGTDVEPFYAALGFAVTHPLQVYVLSPR